MIGATSSDMEILKSFLVVFGLKFIDDKEISKLFNALCIGRERSLALGVGLIPLGPLIKRSSFTRYLNLFKALLIAG